jgi:hypothetical protein
MGAHALSSFWLVGSLHSTLLAGQFQVNEARPRGPGLRARGDCSIPRRGRQGRVPASGVKTALDSAASMYSLGDEILLAKMGLVCYTPRRRT